MCRMQPDQQHLAGGTEPLLSISPRSAVPLLPWLGQRDALSPCDSVPFALLPLENTEAFAVLSPCGCWQFRGKKANSVA